MATIADKLAVIGKRAAEVRAAQEQAEADKQELLARLKASERAQKRSGTK